MCSSGLLAKGVREINKSPNTRWVQRWQRESISICGSENLEPWGEAHRYFPGGCGRCSEVEKAQLWDKKQLFHLGLISRVVDNMHRKNTATNILRPHEDLESSYIFWHIGTSWPNWMASLHNSRIVALSAWDECELLLPLGKLPSLERLTLRWMERVKKVGAEFLGIQDQTSFISSSSLFLKLEEPSFYEMSEWEEWKGVEGWKKDDCELTAIMPCLSFLEIHACPKLKTLLYFCLD